MPGGMHKRRELVIASTFYMAIKDAEMTNASMRMSGISC